MSTPSRHHYLPQWYTKRWAAAGDKRMWVYKRPRDVLWVERKFPKAVGFKDHLYSIKSRSDPEQREQLEKEFMSPLDFEASKALQHMLDTGTRPAHAKLRDGWTRFLLSMLHRTPERVEWITSKLNEHDRQTTEAIRKAYDAAKGDLKQTFEQWLGEQDSSIYEEARAVLIRTLIESKRLGDHISSMHWSLITINGAAHGFLTCDNPLMTSNGLGGRDGFLILPVSPERVFIAVVDPQVRDAFASQEGNAFERAMNDAVCKQAVESVIGHTDLQRRFVDNRLKRGLKREPGFLNRQTWKSPLIWTE